MELVKYFLKKQILKKNPDRKRSVRILIISNSDLDVKVFD